MENRCAYVVLFTFVYLFIYFFEMGFHLELLCHTKLCDKYIFTQPLTENVRLTLCVEK